MSVAMRQIAIMHLKLNPLEAARAVEGFDPSEVAGFLLHAPVEAAAALLGQLAPKTAGACLACLPRESAGRILSALPVPRSVAILRRLDVPLDLQSLSSLDEGVRVKLREALQFPEHTAGALADPRVPALYSDLSVKEAVAQLREFGEWNEPSIPVVDRSLCLVGAVAASRLLSAAEDTHLLSLGIEPANRVLATTDVRALRQGGPVTGRPLVVVDSSGRFLGALSREVLPANSQSAMSPGLAETAAALGEAFWLALCSVSAIIGFVSGARRAERSSSP